MAAAPTLITDARRPVGKLFTLTLTDTRASVITDARQPVGKLFTLTRAAVITDARRQVVDFTTPFMTTRATLVLRRPPPGAVLRVNDLAELVTQSVLPRGVSSVRGNTTHRPLISRLSAALCSARPG